MTDAELLKTEILGMTFPAPVFTAAGPPSRDAAILNAAAENGCGGLVAKTIGVEAAKVARPCMASPYHGKAESMLNIELWSDLPPEAWYGPDGEYQKVREHPVGGKRPLIGSLGYNAEDAKKLIPNMEKFVDAYEFSCHYTTLDETREYASTIRSLTKKPVFAKLSPHGHDLLHLAKELRKCGVDGFVLMNSLGPCLVLDVEREAPILGGPGGKGWLSGSAVRPIAVYWVSALAREMPDVPIIGVGGVSSWHDVVEFMLAGASAVQVCTAAIYKGPKVFKEINDGLIAYCKRKGLKNIGEIRGRALKALETEGNYVPPVSHCDETQCVHCGICTNVCTFEAITVDKAGKKWTVNPDKCYGCGLCTTICPRHCLTVVPRK